MALVSPACGGNFSDMKSGQTVILMHKSKMDANGHPIPATINDMFLPDEYDKVGDKPNAKLQTEDRANSKFTVSKLISYDPELKFSMVHKQLGEHGKLISEFVKGKGTLRDAVWEVWEIHSLTNPTMASDGVTIIGDGFQATRWLGPLTFDYSWPIGDDGKVISREATIKPEFCVSEFELKDAKLAPLISLFAKGEHWGVAGAWDNNATEKIVTTK